METLEHTYIGDRAVGVCCCNGHIKNLAFVRLESFHLYTCKSLTEDHPFPCRRICTDDAARFLILFKLTKDCLLSRTLLHMFENRFPARAHVPLYGQLEIMLPKIRSFIVHAKIIHGHLSLVCTLCNIKI